MHLNRRWGQTAADDTCVSECDKTVSDLEKERELFSRWRDQTAAIQESDQEVQEIREPLDEEAEKRWRGRYWDRDGQQSGGLEGCCVPGIQRKTF